MTSEMAHGGGGVTLCATYWQSLVRLKFRVTCDVSVTEVSRVPVLTQADDEKGISPALQEA